MMERNSKTVERRDLEMLEHVLIEAGSEWDRRIDNAQTDNEG